jgi:CRP-like cAMP-binding protein
MFLVGSGKVQVLLMQAELHKTVASLSAGDFLGEMSLMTGEPRTATCRAATDVRCYELGHATFHQLLTLRPAIADQMSAVLASRQETLLHKSGELSAQSSANSIDSRRALMVKVRRFFNLS